MSMKRLTLKVASNDDGSIPLLTAFPQGVPFDADDMQVIFGQKGDGRKRKQVLIGDLNGVKYRGDDFGDNSRKNDNNRFAVEHIFVMKPKFDNVVVPARYTSMTNAERKQSLTEEFGSRKKKRALKAAQSNTISSENIAGATAVEKAMANQMDDTDANSVLVNAAEDALEKNRQLLLPTYEIEAVIVDEAYPIKSLIPPHLSNALRERYEVMNTEMLRASSEPAAKLDVFNWVQRLESEFSSSLVSISLGNLSTEDKKSSKKHSTNVSRILLLHYMLRFYLKITASYDRVETRTDIARATSAPEVVLDYFADTFCTKVQMRGKHDSLSCSKASM